jgi:hypothetical protein
MILIYVYIQRGQNWELKERDRKTEKQIFSKKEKKRKKKGSKPNQTTMMGQIIFTVPSVANLAT